MRARGKAKRVSVASAIGFITNRLENYRKYTVEFRFRIKSQYIPFLLRRTCLPSPKHRSSLLSWHLMLAALSADGWFINNSIVLLTADRNAMWQQCDVPHNIHLSIVAFFQQKELYHWRLMIALLNGAQFIQIKFQTIPKPTRIASSKWQLGCPSYWSHIFGEIVCRHLPSTTQKNKRIFFAVSVWCVRRSSKHIYFTICQELTLIQFFSLLLLFLFFGFQN